MQCAIYSKWIRKPYTGDLNLKQKDGFHINNHNILRIISCTKWFLTYKSNRKTVELKICDWNAWFTLLKKKKKNLFFLRYNLILIKYNNILTLMVLISYIL
jgi:hypothetical protein